MAYVHYSTDIFHMLSHKRLIIRRGYTMGHCLKKYTKEKENILISPVWKVTPEHDENDESRNELF